MNSSSTVPWIWSKEVNEIADFNLSKLLGEKSFQVVDEVSNEVLDLVALIFSCVHINIFAVSGLLGATINIVVMSSYNITKDTSNILLISLSFADLVFCFTIPICRSKCIVSYFVDMPTALIVDVIVTERLAFFNRAFYYTSITLAETISVERFLVVFFPFRIPSMLTPFSVKLLALSVYAVNLALASPGFFCLTHGWVFSESHNRSLPVQQITEFYKNNYDAINLDITLVYNNGVLGTSLLLTTTLTSAIAVKLWLLTLQRERLIQKKCSFDLQVAKILTAVCTLSVVVYGPFIVYITATYFIPGYSIVSNTFKLYNIITDFSGTLCASANFLIYVTMSSKFRRQYSKLMSRWCMTSRKSKT